MTADISNLQTAATQAIGRKKYAIIGALAALSAYFIYVFIAFDVVGLSQKASMENAKILVSDSYSYKVHVARDNRSSDVSIKIEGETKGAYADGE
ncbi:MAG: phosphonate ABC transporter, permease protein PhnE, partial [Rhodobacteraceae bacterium]|nr:phosphonate ABC transporter, permease protein PhnE [Paracoccaceae bacterium]